jgi:hypothetical protein
MYHHAAIARAYQGRTRRVGRPGVPLRRAAEKRDAGMLQQPLVVHADARHDARWPGRSDPRCGRYLSHRAESLPSWALRNTDALQIRMFRPSAVAASSGASDPSSDAVVYLGLGTAEPSSGAKSERVRPGRSAEGALVYTQEAVPTHGVVRRASAAGRSLGSGGSAYVGAPLMRRIVTGEPADDGLRGREVCDHQLDRETVAASPDLDTVADAALQPVSE